METNEIDRQNEQVHETQAISKESPVEEATDVDYTVKADGAETPVASIEEDATGGVDSADAEKSSLEDLSNETTDTDPEEEAAEPIELPMYQTGKESVPLTTVLESLLFVAELGIKPSQFSQALECPIEEIEIALKLLGDSYKEDRRGLRIQERAGRYTMVTTPIAAKAIEAFLELDLTTKLSGPALEALSVIAYRQPATRPQIEAVRGVDCGGVIKTLLQHEMIEEVGRLDAPGRPILYGVTDFFMQHFGLTELQDLPPLETTEADILWAATQIAEDGATEEGEEGAEGEGEEGPESAVDVDEEGVVVEDSDESEDGTTDDGNANEADDESDVNEDDAVDADDVAVSEDSEIIS